MNRLNLLNRHQNPSRRRPASFGRATIAFALVGLAACGGDDDEPAAEPAAESTEAPATTPEPTTPPTAAPTTVAETAAPAETAEATAEGGDADTTVDADAVVPVSLIEWEIVAPTEFAAGTVTFEVSADGEFPHELVIYRGDSYETLPLEANGAVAEDQLPEGDLIGRTDTLDAGTSTTLTVELEPGNYVLACNIAVGPNSHAAAGQVLSVIVG